MDTDRRRENQHVDINGRRESQHVDTKGGNNNFTINCENQDSNSRPWALIPYYECATCILEGPKATTYSTCTGVKYARNTLTMRETTIYKYSSNKK
jgi:hypothetical protein